MGNELRCSEKETAFHLSAVHETPIQHVRYGRQGISAQLHAENERLHVFLLPCAHGDWVAILKDLLAASEDFNHVIE
jgi:hypothetical protein